MLILCANIVLFCTGAYVRCCFHSNQKWIHKILIDHLYCSSAILKQHRVNKKLRPESLGLHDFLAGLA